MPRKDESVYDYTVFIGKGYRAVPLKGSSVDSNLRVRNKEFLYSPESARIWGQTFFPKGYAVIEYDVPSESNLVEEEYYFYLEPRVWVSGRVLGRKGSEYRRNPPGYWGKMQGMEGGKYVDYDIEEVD